MPGPPRRGTYFGWYLTAALGITTIVSYGVTQYLFGVLVVPVSRDLGAGRGAVSGAYGLALVVSGILGIPAGRLVDSRGGRWLTSAGSLLGAAALVGLSTVHSLAGWYLGWAALGVAMAATLYPVTMAIVANFFVRRRGTALAALTVTGGLSSAIYIPLAGWLVASLGWRSALVFLAVTVVAIALPLHALFVRRRPEDMGLSPDGERDRPLEPRFAGARVGAALRGAPFWLLTLAYALSAAAYGTVLAHGVAYLLTLGLRPVAAAGLFGLVGIASLPGRLTFNLLADRMSPAWLLAAAMLMQGVGTLLLVLAGSRAGGAWLVYGFVAIYGLAFGAISPLRAAVAADHFGRREYALITAASNLPGTILQAAGPLVAGILYDRLGSYRLAFLLVAAAFALAAAAVAAMPEPPAATA